MMNEVHILVHFVPFFLYHRLLTLWAGGGRVPNVVSLLKS